MSVISYVDAMILHAYKPLVEKYGVTQENLESFAINNPFLDCSNAADRLIYFLIDKCRYQMREFWPLCDNELEPYFLDMGIALE